MSKDKKEKKNHVKYEDIMNPEDPLTIMKETLLQAAGQVLTDGDLEKAYSAYKRSDADIDQAKFDYSCCLIRSKHSSNIEYGVKSLKVLYGSLNRRVEAGDKDVDMQLSSACLYYIAFGFFRLLKFDMAVLYGNLILNANNGSGQAKAIVSLSTDIIRYPQLYEQVFKKKFVEKGSSSVLSPKKEVDSKINHEKVRTDKKNLEAAKILKKQKKIREKERLEQQKKDEEDAKKNEKLMEKKRKDLQKKKVKKEAKGINDIGDLAEEFLDDDLSSGVSPISIPTRNEERRPRKSSTSATEKGVSPRKDRKSPRNNPKSPRSKGDHHHHRRNSHPEDKDKKKYIANAKKAIDKKELKRMKKENIPFAPPAPAPAKTTKAKTIATTKNIHAELKEKVDERKEIELTKLQEELAEKEKRIERREKILQEEAQLQEEMEEVLPFYDPLAGIADDDLVPYEDPQFFDDDELEMLGGSENLARLRKNLATLEEDYSDLLGSDMANLDDLDSVMVRPLVDIAEIDSSFAPIDTAYTSSLQTTLDEVLPSLSYDGGADSYLSTMDSGTDSYLSMEPAAAIDSIVPPPVWIVIRRFGKRGGKKVERPYNMIDLLILASEKFNVEIVKIRELDTEAEVEDTAAIKPDSIVLALTAEDEAEFE